MLKISDNKLKHIYKGELVKTCEETFCSGGDSCDSPGNISWEKCQFCPKSIGSLLLDFNNFRKDQTVFLLHTSEYMEKPSLVTLVRMAKYCEMESELMLSRIQRKEFHRYQDTKLARCMRNIYRVSKKTIKWSHAKLTTLIYHLPYFTVLKDAAQKVYQDDETYVDVVLKILTRWKSEEYRAILSEHEMFVLVGASYQLYQEIFEHMYAIYFRLKVCNLRYIFTIPPLWRYDEEVLPRSSIHYTSPDIDLNQPIPYAKYFKVHDFLNLCLCGTVSNFTKTIIHPLHRSYRSECDLFGDDHHQLFSIGGNIRIVSNNISLQSRAGGRPLIDLEFNYQKRGKTIKETMQKVSDYNKKRMLRIGRLHSKETHVYMGLSVRPILVPEKKHDGSYGQKVFLEHQPTWFHPRALYPSYSRKSSSYNLDRFLWSDPIWRTTLKLTDTRECIDDSDGCEN